jgi:hypothetical protein|tara:strand:+ start:60 stop:314 length:255 start_codon:yes stop_codon:yes gene_type:complete
MIEYQKKKVTPKVFAKHIISDELMKIFDRLKHNPQEISSNWQYLTSKEEDTVLDQVSLFEDRIHKLLGVKFKSITSSNTYEKSI